jgi:MFS family permease
VLTQALSWHWIFFVNVPIGFATLVAARIVLVPERGPGLQAGADVAGGVLVTAGLMLTVTAIVGAAEHGWASGRTLGLGAVSLLLLAGFVARQARAAHPLLPLRLFRSRAVTGANVVQMFMVAGMFGFLFIGTLYMQEVLRYDEIETGLAIVPVALGSGALSLGPSPRLVARFGARAVLLPGLALIVAGLALLARAPADAVYAVDLLPVTLLLGVGAGLVLPALMTLAMSGATPADSGLASGLVNTRSAAPWGWRCWPPCRRPAATPWPPRGRAESRPCSAATTSRSGRPPRPWSSPSPWRWPCSGPRGRRPRPVRPRSRT